MRKTVSSQLFSKGWQLIAALALLIVLALTLSQVNSAAGQPAPTESGGIDRLVADTNGAVEISLNSATGVASFVRMPHDAALSTSSNGSASEAAGAFFQHYGDAFGIKDAGSELVLANSDANQLVGGVQLTYQQVYEEVPVFAAVLKARLSAQNQVTSVNGTFVPNIKLNSTTPTLSADEAGQIAVNTVASQSAGASSRLSLDGFGNLDMNANASHDLAAVNSLLYVFRTGLVQGVAGRDHLVYEVEVTNSDISTREFVYVDAHTGAVVDQITGIFHGLDREVSEGSLANVVWDESNGDPDPIPAGWAGGTAQQVTDWNNEIDGAKETYNLFASMAGRDSYDGAGATMRTVNNDPGISCPNATWNGTSTNYCSDVTGDDTVAHEWGHAYTEYTNNLIYQWQSGALNESYSDIWGEAVDFLNGRGSDAPGGLRTAGSCSTLGAGAPSVDNSYRWLSGEDDPAFGGAIRDLWNPTCYNDPGKVTDTEYWCATDDGGGVHTNSGVPNHAFALMTDGGTYNGVTVTGLGLTKASHIHWGAQTMLTPASNFIDHADALEASCTALIGINLPALSTSSGSAGPSGEIISGADCTEVADAIAATELRTEPTQCDFGPLLDPNAPALCEGQGSVQSIASEDWEGGTLPAGWSVGTHSVANPPTFDTPDWAVVGSLPAGANGTYAAMVEDLIIGDCAADDESGALYLDSPAFVVPAGAIPHVAFDHWVATEYGWDGGNLKVSVNGGAWTLVPPSQFEFNVYNDSLNSVGAGNTNPLEGQPAFTGTDGGSVGGSWGQSQVNLIGMALPGDSVKLRFDFGIDGCNGVVGWYVDDIEVYSCSEELPPVCGDSILDPGESCDDGNTANGDGCSDVCQVEDGWTCEDPTPPSDGKNVIDDGSFEAGAFGGIWDEYSLTFGTPLCDVGSCGVGGGSGPSDGDWWAWFGGIAAAEEGSVSQDVTIPTTSTDLTFDLELPVCDSADDYLELWVDGNLEFSVDGGSSACGTVGYETQTVDLSSYADGASHTIEFYSEIFATNAGGSNFFVDDVYLSDNTDTEGSASVCTRPTKMYLPAIRSYASSVPDLPLLNGDFELGAVDWDEYSSHGWDLIFPSSVLPIAPKNGDWATWLGGGDDEVSYIEQTVKVPEGAPYLTYWHYIDSIDFECGWDFGGVGVGGNWFYQYDLCESENTSDWEKVVVDMSIYEGLLIDLAFVTTTDDFPDSYSSLYVDVITFEATDTSLSGAVQPNFAGSQSGFSAASGQERSSQAMPDQDTPRKSH